MPGSRWAALLVAACLGVPAAATPSAAAATAAPVALGRAAAAPADNRGRVDRPTSQNKPYSAIVQIETDAGTCTGALIDPNSVLTAGHCLYDKVGKRWADAKKTLVYHNVVDCPDYTYCHKEALACPVKDRNRRAGMWVPDTWRSTPLPEGFDHDYGVINLGCRVKLPRGAYFRLRVDPAADLRGRSVATAGFPDDKPMDTMWRSVQTVTSSTPLSLRTNGSSWHGQSGSPIWNSTNTCPQCVIAVLSNGSGPDEAPYFAGPRITLEAFNAIYGFAAEDVAFLVDSTGSMGDFLPYLRTAVASVAEQSPPGTRFAAVQFNDTGDNNGGVNPPVSTLTDFTTDRDALLRAVGTGALQPGGGGDGPEAGLLGLSWARDHLTWRTETSGTVVVVTDAGFHDPQPGLDTGAEELLATLVTGPPDGPVVAAAPRVPAGSARRTGLDAGQRTDRAAPGPRRATAADTPPEPPAPPADALVVDVVTPAYGADEVAADYRRLTDGTGGTLVPFDRDLVGDALTTVFAATVTAEPVAGELLTTVTRQADGERAGTMTLPAGYRRQAGVCGDDFTVDDHVFTYTVPNGDPAAVWRWGSDDRDLGTGVERMLGTSPGVPAYVSRGVVRPPSPGSATVELCLPGTADLPAPVDVVEKHLYLMTLV